MPGKPYFEGRLIVMFEKISLEEAEKVITSYKLSVLDNWTFAKLRILLISVPKGKEEKWIRKLKKDHRIISVSLDRKLKAF